MLSGKNNLNVGTATIDFQLLLKTVNIAVGLAKTECERDLSRAQTNSFAGDIRKLQHDAKALAEHAAQFATASEMLHMLYEGSHREIELTNITQQKIN